MIPKTLIYGNFGHMTFRPDVEQLCMKSWEEVFPKSEWTWIELNESNVDINSHPYMKKAYEKKLYSFVNDYARTQYLEQHGGVYIDTDQLMLKPLTDEILSQKMFIGSCMHEEIEETKKPLTSWRIVGTEARNPFIQHLLQSFDIDDSFKMVKGRLTVMSETRHLLLNLEKVDKKEFLKANQPMKYEHLTLYPFDYFTGMFWNSDKTFITDNTFGIQLYGSSWQTKSIKSFRYDKIQSFLSRLV